MNHNSKKFIIAGGTKNFQSLSYKSPIEKNIVYCGSISNLTGIIDFAILFNKLNLSGISLHIYGGISYKLEELAKLNTSIKLFGFVNRDILEDAMNNAWIFVNPRNNKEEDKLNTFPSKLLEYFRYGKPIISTHISSLNTDINNLIYFFDLSNSNTIVNLLNKLNNYNEKDLIEIYNNYKLFCLQNNWDIKVRNFLIELDSYK